MKKTLCLALALLLICSMFAGCSTAKQETPAPAETPAADTQQPAQNTAEDPAPAETPAETPAFTKLDIACFTGGYGDMWAELVDLFKQTYPDVEVVADLSNDVEARVRARMLTDTPPDVIFISGSEEYDVNTAAASGMLLALDDWFANGVNADGDPMSEVMTEGRLASGMVNGSLYLPSWSTSYGGWWYNKALFEKNGWTVPTTWEELYEIAPKIKEAGIIPVMYQSINYAIWGYMYQAVAAAGGYETYADCFINLKEGAWLSDGALTAATNLQNLVKDGILSETSVGVEFTQAQIDFVNDRVAMIPCGCWFENEMKDSTPDGFEMTFMPFPAVDSEGNHYLTAFDANIAVPAKSNNPEAAKAFLGILYSKEGQKIVAKYGSYPVSSKISEDDVAEYMTPAMASALDAAADGKIKFVSNNPENWYAGMWPTLQDGITNLVLQDITPEDFCQSMEDAAAMIREDDSVPKHSTN